jgi:hypothetical protein
MSETEASYEVCILVGSRWEIHARYPVTGAQQATEEAKQLEQTTRSAVKVVREVYDAKSGLYRQATIYKSAHAPSRPESPASKALRFRSQAGRPGYTREDDDDLWEEDAAGASGPAKAAGGFLDGLTYRRNAAPRGKPKQITVAGLLLRVIHFHCGFVLAAAVVTVLMPSWHTGAPPANLAGGGQTAVLLRLSPSSLFLITFAILAAIVRGRGG